MKVTVTPSSIGGTIEAPASKSSMQRALAAALLHKGITYIQNPGNSNDDLAALENVQRLGANITMEGNRMRIESSGIHPREAVLDCGESGLGIRMFTPIAALSSKELTITGSGSLRTRPMDFFDEIFPKLGIRIDSQHGRLPMVIQGPLQPRSIEVDGSLSSQFLTGLLMAFAAAGAADVSIDVRDLKSKPYIDLTLSVLHAFGWTVENRAHRQFYFSGKYVHRDVVDYQVEGDWSGAAFLLVAAALAGDTVITGLDPFSTQADKAVLTALQQAGVQMSIEANRMEIRKSRLNAFHFDATECPDLFPPLVALAAFCEGTTTIEGANRLTHKESNRALTLQEEFGKLGVSIRLQEDIMLIEGVEQVRAATTQSHHDHRIAMACAVAALRADGPVEIEGAEAIGKSYPDFYEDMRSLGANINE
jgi:3-phosphoshikimate 1-carboxyvinyltransferase